MTVGLRRRLNDTWASPPGIVGWLGAVNHKQVGLRYIVTAFGFFLLAGVDVTVIRAQLAVPDAEILSPERFNQLFTTHGTGMMFLFAIPMVEGIAIYVVPLMLGAREMAFPRLNAFGYWLYLFGGLLLYASTVPDIINFLWPGEPILQVVVPDAGWFAYPPLSSSTYSPGLGLDFWLMGVTLAELSALVAAIEIGATILTIRAAGMTPMRLPLFAWSVLVMAFAIIFAFPAVVLASAFLELERAFGVPFYDPAAGGDPLLWQHLFWIFGHPEVYIMFIPATGIVSMIIPAFTGRPIVGYGFIVAALIGTAVLSFGLWVHHMFAVGLPWLGLAYFSAASMLITIPSGVQVFAWLATMLKAPRLRLTTPMLFVVGFLVTFVLGGVTGVMVASVPFDLQAHDTYFVVAHFHYVLVGGVVFPIFAGLYYWFPKATGRLLSEHLGRWFFWLFFIGFNLAFLPQHQLGLLGMRRRVYTYQSEPWVDLLNLVSSIGQGVMVVAMGVLGVAIFAAWRSRPDAPGDPWNGRSLEWAVPSPPGQHNFTRLPTVGGLEPLADDPSLANRLDAAPDGMRSAKAKERLPRETLTVHPLDGSPDMPTIMPQNSLMPLVAAAAIAGVFAAFLFRLYPVAMASAVAAAGVLLVWAWRAASENAEPAPATTLGLETPRGRPARAHVAWGALLTMAVLATLYLDAVFAHLYLAYKADAWPPADVTLPNGIIGGIGVALAAAAAATLGLGWRRLRAGRSAPVRALLSAGIAAMIGSALLATWDTIATAPDPAASGYAAGLWGLMGSSIALLIIAAGVAGFALARTRDDRSGERALRLQLPALWSAFAATAALLAWGIMQAGPVIAP